MAHSISSLSPELQDSLNRLSQQWEQARIHPEQQRTTQRTLEMLLSEAALQMGEEGQLTPSGPAYTPAIRQAVLKLHLTALNAMVLKAHEERLPAEDIEPLLTHGAYRSLEQARNVVKSHLDNGHPIENDVAESEVKRFLSEAAIYALSYTIESYRQQKSQQAPAAPMSYPASIPQVQLSSPKHTPSTHEDPVFLKQILLLLIGISLILFAADRITASGLDGPMVLMCLMFGMSASFGYYFYSVLQHQQREIKALQKRIPEEESPVNKALPSLGVPTLEIQLGRGLDMLQATVMLPMELTLFRTKMAEDLGLQLPEIPITLKHDIGDSKFRILLRGDVIAQGQAFPPRMMVTDQQLEQAHLTAPAKSIPALDEASGEDVHWIPADWPALTQIQGKPKSASRVILKHLENTIFANMDEIVGQTDILAVIDRVRELSPGLVNRVVPSALSEGAVRRIWVNLLRERVPVKDVTFIFERLVELSAISREPDALSEQLRLAMARKLCQMHLDVSGVMYVIVLSESWEHRLIASFNQPQWTTPFGLNTEEMDALAETTVSRILYAENTYHCRPVLLCPPGLRMALFMFLNHYIPGITVLSHAELIPDTQVEVVGTVDA